MPSNRPTPQRRRSTPNPPPRVTRTRLALFRFSSGGRGRSRRIRPEAILPPVPPDPRQTSLLPASSIHPDPGSSAPQRVGGEQPLTKHEFEEAPSCTAGADRQSEQALRRFKAGPPLADDGEEPHSARTGAWPQSEDISGFSSGRWGAKTTTTKRQRERSALDESSIPATPGSPPPPRCPKTPDLGAPFQRLFELPALWSPTSPPQPKKELRSPRLLSPFFSHCRLCSEGEGDLCCRCAAYPAAGLRPRRSRGPCPAQLGQRAAALAPLPKSNKRCPSHPD